MKSDTSSRRVCSAFVVLLLSSCLLGCTQAPSKPRLRLAYQDRVADAAVILAVRKGFFADEGIDLAAVRFTSGPACSEAVLSGSVDVGTMGDSTCVIALASPAPVTLIASHGGGEHRHRIIVGINSGIKDVPDLMGKKLAVKKGTSTYGGLLAWAAKQNIDLSNVNVIDLNPADMADALRTAGVDAIVASEPTPSLLESKDCGVELTTLGGLGNTYPITLILRDDFGKKHPDVVVKALRAIDRAEHFINNHRREAAEEVAAATGLSADVTLAAMSHHTYNLGLSPATMTSLRDIAEFLRAQKVIEEVPDFDAKTDRTYLDRLPKE